MRIAYGIHGFGRGHAMRSMAVLPVLAERHELLVLAGGDAYDALQADYPVVRIPHLKYYFNRRGKLSNVRTIMQCAPLLLDVWLKGPSSDMVAEALTSFGAELVITDSELFTHHVPRRLNLPRITFDHFGLLAYARPTMSRRERVANWGNAWVYRLLYGHPDRAVVTGFFPAEPRRAGVQVVGPVIRREVRRVAPSAGDHLLVYFNRREQEFAPQIVAALRQLPIPVRAYGLPYRGRDGNIEYRPLGNLPFIQDLAGCRAVFGTTGNQLIGEVLYFGKPMLGMPMACHEQRLNAYHLEQMGLGMRAPRGRVSVELLERFLGRVDELSANVRREFRDGAQEALAALEAYAAELIGKSAGMKMAG